MSQGIKLFSPLSSWKRSACSSVEGKGLILDGALGGHSRQGHV